ncbi:hypothetical protein HX001_14355 [Empedobacter brevis]|uniref:Uncharacterized protein n=1 Tax=Empedobacter brevis TaxID=247 RepID=A0AAJ1QGL3_9FLAO|nr:hypothetical protein [Empedobacter brevis]MDM1073668.1 hypothetical protein [Empedobacter brevis]
MKLTSMTDFVLEQEKLNQKNTSRLACLCANYAQFLKQPLTLGKFVPCDEEGNVWKFPPTQEEWEWCEKDSTEAEQSFKQKEFYYQQAKERVLFEGFEIKVSNITNNLQNDFLIISETNEIIGHENKDQWFFNPYKKVEDLINYDLTLTQTAIKQIGL